MVLSPWNCAHMFKDLETQFVNVLTGYYWILMGLMHVQDTYGAGWVTHYLPQTTIENTSCDVGFFVARCLHHPEDLPFLPWHHREVPAEHHFSAVKDNVRGGMPKYKDMILGSLYVIPWHVHVPARTHIPAHSKICIPNARTSIPKYSTSTSKHTFPLFPFLHGPTTTGCIPKRGKPNCTNGSCI